MLTPFGVNTYFFSEKQGSFTPGARLFTAESCRSALFSPEASETNRSSVSEKCYSVSFCAMILQMADTSDLSTQIFRNIFCLYMIRKIRNTIR